jgi:hypothetical protein
LNVEHQSEQVGDFGGTVSPAYQTVVPGDSTTYQINIFPLNSFDSDVHLDIEGLPPGATATFAPAVVAGGSGSSILTIATVSPTPTNTYHLTIAGGGGGVKHQNGMNLNVGPAGTDFTDYTGSVTPQSQTISASSGGSITFTFMIQPINGTGCVYLQVAGVFPAATSGSFDRSTPICGSAATTVFTITPSPQTPTGTYTLTFQGSTSGGFAHSGNVTLVVTP